MAQSPSDLKLKIISMNVRGIRNLKKRRSLFHIFKQNKYDVICLQETHLTNNDKNTIQNEWGSHFHLSEGTTHSNGLLTLFNSSLQIENAKQILKGDRYLISCLSIEDTYFAVANFYGPCINEEKQLFLESFQMNINKVISDFGILNVMALGDFNLVKDNNLDIVSGKPHPINLVKLFNNKINELLMTDIWRENNGCKKEFTWSRNKPFLARRLDYIFITNELLPFCMDATIKTVGFSDHRAVLLSLDFASFKRGPGTFKFNTSLLHNKHFVEDVKKEIKNIITMNLNPHLSWEYVKIQIKSLGMVYGRALGRERNFTKTVLYDQLDEVEKKIIYQS